MTNKTSLDSVLNTLPQAVRANSLKMPIGLFHGILGCREGVRDSS
jgi:hypothetical protein